MTLPSSESSVLEVRGLKVGPRGTNDAWILKGVDFEVRRSESLAIIGESGAGKSLAVKTVCGLLPENLRAEGSVRVHGRSVSINSPQSELLGRRLLYLSQQPMSAFDPLSRLGRQIEETLKVHFPDEPIVERRKRIDEIFRFLRFEDPAAVLSRFPSELSGGMLQRAMTAIAILLKPEAVVADEPTSALDVLSVREVLKILKTIQEQTGAALIVITHDLSFAEALARRFIVMKSGRIVESGGPEILQAPRHPYFKHLVQMRHSMKARLTAALQGVESASSNTPTSHQKALPRLLEVRRLQKSYCKARSSFFSLPRSVSVLAGLNLDIQSGETVALVGASGEGKSTLSRLLLGLEKPDAGTIRINGMNLEQWQKLNPGAMSVVSQNYEDSADPTWSVADILAEPLKIKLLSAETDQAKRIRDKLTEAYFQQCLSRVGLSNDKLHRHPHELSGGELQRVCIARALISDPRFVVFDEALSSLDAAVQGEILELLLQLRTKDSSWLFISHDLKAVAALCDRVLFLHGGRIVESIAADKLAKVSSPTAKQLLGAALL